MKHPRLSEKDKDRIVNGALVFSIAFVLVGFLYQPETASTTTPSESPRPTNQLQPLNIAVPPVAKTVEPLPEPISDKDASLPKNPDKKSSSNEVKPSAKQENQNKHKDNKQKEHRFIWSYNRRPYLEIANRGIFNWQN